MMKGEPSRDDRKAIQWSNMTKIPVTKYKSNIKTIIKSDFIVITNEKKLSFHVILRRLIFHVICLEARSEEYIISSIRLFNGFEQ